MKRLFGLLIVMALLASSTGCRAEKPAANQGDNIGDYLTQEEINSNTNLETDALTLILDYVYAKYDPSPEEQAALDQVVRYMNGEILRASDPSLETPRIFYSPVSPDGSAQEHFVFPTMSLYNVYGPEMLALILMEEAAHAADFNAGLTDFQGNTREEAIEEEVRAAHVTTRYWIKYLSLVERGLVQPTPEPRSEIESAEIEGYTYAASIYESNPEEWETLVRAAAEDSYNPDGTMAPLIAP